MDAAEAERRLSGDLGMAVSNYSPHTDGFSFTVPTEANAYKAAHKYRYSRRVDVQPAPNISAWYVSIYDTDPALTTLIRNYRFEIERAFRRAGRIQAYIAITMSSRADGEITQAHLSELQALTAKLKDIDDHLGVASEP